ncbi:MAG: AAA family ATPase [Pseudomonadota bacterium]
MTELDQLATSKQQLARLKNKIAERVVGHDKVVHCIVAALLAGGHVLLEGVPGLGKTLLVKTLSDALRLQFSRVQFTPDLMPADIIGTQIVMQDDSGARHFEFQPGPIFTQLLLADEINRATPKTQSALLEAMEENSVSVGRTIRTLDAPFMVLATQNPIEMEGTYPLPEAQLDRFMLKLTADFPDIQELSTIVDRATGAPPPPLEPELDEVSLLALRTLVRDVVAAQHVKDYALRLVLATHPHTDLANDACRRFVRHGASPRAALSLVLIAKAFAVMDGRMNISFDDINLAAPSVLAHRVLLNFEGEAEGIDPETLVGDIVTDTPEVLTS